MIGEVPLGRTARRISAIGLGTGTFGREIDPETSWRLMDYAVERGITFFDTAEVYGGGILSPTGVVDQKLLAERIIGAWLRERNCRDKITLCTKISGGRGAPEAIATAVRDSLDRLGIDRIDVYKMHRPDPTTPIGETLDALAREVAAGRIDVIGCSNYSAEQLREALDASAAGGLPRFEITQPAYNLVNRGDEPDLFPLCRAEEIAVTPHSPLGNGFLTGKYTPDRTKLPAGTRLAIAPSHTALYFHQRGWEVLARLREKSEELGVPMNRLAMAWAMSHPDVTSLLVGARETHHIDNALEARDMELPKALRDEMSAW